jgi:hypothetical protein
VQCHVSASGEICAWKKSFNGSASGTNQNSGTCVQKWGMSPNLPWYPLSKKAS